MTDIIIIGGGIAGISAAARISKHANVKVLEAETTLGYHASGRSAALFEENYGCASVTALNSASADYHHTANGGYLTPRGFLILGRSGEDEEFERDIADLKTTEISPTQARPSWLSRERIRFRHRPYDPRLCKDGQTQWWANPYECQR